MRALDSYSVLHELEQPFLCNKSICSYRGRGSVLLSLKGTMFFDKCSTCYSLSTDSIAVLIFLFLDLLSTRPLLWIEDQTA